MREWASMFIALQRKSSPVHLSTVRWARLNETQDIWDYLKIRSPPVALELNDPKGEMRLKASA